MQTSARNLGSRKVKRCPKVLQANAFLVQHGIHVELVT